MPGTLDQFHCERETDLSDVVAKMSIAQIQDLSDPGSLPEVKDEADPRVTKLTDLLEQTSRAAVDDKENESEQLNKVASLTKKPKETKAIPKPQILKKADKPKTRILSKNDACPGIEHKTKAHISNRGSSPGIESKTKARILPRLEASPKIAPKSQSKSKTTVVAKGQIEPVTKEISNDQNTQEAKNVPECPSDSGKGKKTTSRNLPNKNFPKVEARTKTQTTVAFGMSTTPKEKKVPGTPKNLENLKQNNGQKSQVLLAKAIPRSPVVSHKAKTCGQPASAAPTSNGQAKNPNVVRSQPGSKTVRAAAQLTPRSPVTPQGGVFLNDHAKARTQSTDIKPQNQNESKPVSRREIASTKRQNQNGSDQNGSSSQTTLTSFFPVRRSERKPKQESEAIQQKLIVERLETDSDVGLGLEIRQVPEKGRGIFSTQMFSKGDFVIEYSGDLIDVKMAKEREGEYSMDLSKGCYMYYFRANGRQYCIDATKESGRWGRLINHSRQMPNLQTKVVMLKDLPRLILIAKRDIDIGEELLYDYGDRSKESLEAHPWLAL